MRKTAQHNLNFTIPTFDVRQKHMHCALGGNESRRTFQVALGNAIFNWRLAFLVNTLFCFSSLLPVLASCAVLLPSIILLRIYPASPSISECDSGAFLLSFLSWSEWLGVGSWTDNSSSRLQSSSKLTRSWMQSPLSLGLRHRHRRMRTCNSAMSPQVSTIVAAVNGEPVQAAPAVQVQVGPDPDDPKGNWKLTQASRLLWNYQSTLSLPRLPDRLRELRLSYHTQGPPDQGNPATSHGKSAVWTARDPVVHSTGDGCVDFR